MKNQIENKYNCGKALWKKMSDIQKIVYNNLRGIKVEFVLPNSPITNSNWETISHNFSYLAACEFR